MAFSRSTLHLFVSAIADDPAAVAAGEVVPSNWNAGHTVAVAGATSGGIPYFSGATTEGSSALLASGGIIIGGGAGNPPFTDTGLTYDSTNQALTVGGGTVTASTPVLNLSQTWNNAAVKFTGILAVFTRTNFAGSSLLLDLQTEQGSQFSVSNAGAITGGATFVQTSTSFVGFQAQGAGCNNFSLGGAGANFGHIANIDADTWGLGYGGTTTSLGTYPIKWTDNGAITLTPTGNDVIIASGKNLQLGNAYVAGVQIPTGYITVKDSSGTVYKLSCNL